MTIATAPSTPNTAVETQDTQPLLLDVSNTKLTVTIIGLIPLVPDFVVELRSETDSLSEAQKKMRDYQQVSVRMGLLIDPKKKRVEIYRPGQEVEILEAPKSIDCNEVMPGFILDMSKIW